MGEAWTGKTGIKRACCEVEAFYQATVALDTHAAQSRRVTLTEPSAHRPANRPSVPTVRVSV